MPTDSIEMLDDLRQSFARSSDTRRHRPFITLSFAQSLDGCLSARTGFPFALSGPDALKLTHAIRSSHDGILVGIGTVLADNPQLNVRLTHGPSPQRIILDSHLRISASSRILNDSGQKPWIFCSRHAPLTALVSLRAQGARVWSVPHDERGLCLKSILKILHEQDIRHIMIEGGAKVISRFMESECVDFTIVTISPLVLGHEQAVRYRLPNAQRYLRWQNARSTALGPDIIFWGEPRWRSLSTPSHSAPYEERVS